MTGSSAVLVRTPMRISLAGGGTDLPSYADQRGGLVIGTAIDQYVCVVAFPREFTGAVRVLSDTVEYSSDGQDLSSPYLVALLRRHRRHRDLQVAVLSGAPPGTGLGGSGAFTVAVTHALATLNDDPVDPARLAHESSEVEITDLGRPVGRQDHYLASFGGIRALRIGRDRQVGVESILATPELDSYLRENLLLFYTGVTRDAGAVLADQSRAVATGQAERIEVLDGIHGLARELEQDLADNRVAAIGEVLHEHWRLKRRLSSGVSAAPIDEMYRTARAAGAVGGKLLGAGGGGFLLVAVEGKYRSQVREALSAIGGRELEFGPSRRGSDAAVLTL